MIIIWKKMMTEHERLKYVISKKKKYVISQRVIGAMCEHVQQVPKCLGRGLHCKPEGGHLA